MTPSSLFALIGEHAEIIISIGSAAVAAASALLARSETRRQRRIQTETLRSNIDSASLDWGNQAIETLSHAAMFSRLRHLQSSDATFNANRADLLVQISSLVDRGRMFFPNIDPDGRGVDKEGAYRGSRPPILQTLMWVYYELCELKLDGDPDADASAGFIDDCRRLLVSELQGHLDPRRRDEIVERYDDQKLENRTAAMQRANALKERLLERRTSLKADQL